MRFTGGWVKFYRRAIFGAIGAREGNDCLGLWIRILGMASVQESEIFWNGEMRNLKPGQIVTSIAELANSTRTRNISATRRQLEFLETRGSIRQETGKKPADNRQVTGRNGRLITICNWERYQHIFSEAADNQQETDKKSADNRQRIEEREQERRRGGGVPPKKQPSIERATIEACGQTWLETIALLGGKRTRLIRVEEETIARAIAQHGAETVDLALFGARFEPKFDDFDPRQNIDITRVLTKDKHGKERIQRFVGYGSKQRSEGREVYNPETGKYEAVTA